jgi:[ribosomal protein S5]-alanine N-acetyltransferase
MREFPILKTERLILRNLVPEDQADVFAIYSNPAVTRLCDMTTLENLRQAGATTRVFQAEFEQNSGVRWAITQKGSTRLIGLCGIGWYRHNFSALLSYDLNQSYWNLGLMTEAVRAVVRYAFAQPGMNRITATTVPENPASIQVLRHAGFQEEGILHDWGFWKGQFKDLRCFSLLRRDIGTPGAPRQSTETLTNPPRHSATEPVGSSNHPLRPQPSPLICPRM